MLRTTLYATMTLRPRRLTLTITQCSYIHDGTYRVILRIVEAGYRPVAIDQVVEH